MRADYLIARVSSIMDSGGYSDADILVFLNRGVLDVAGGGTRPHGMPLVAPLPDLATSVTVATATDAAYKTLGNTYQRGVFMVVDADGNEVEIYDSYIKFLKKYPGQAESGDIELCCVKGSNLHYQPIPSVSVNLTVYCHRLPVDMVNDDDEPDGIPEHLQDRLLVSFACWQMFNEMEDGIEGKKVNTNKYEGLYHAALTDIERFIGPEDQRAQNIDDDSDYIN